MLDLQNRVSSELKLGYLVAVVVVLFLLPYPTTIAILLLLQTGLWISFSLGWRPLLRIVKRLVFFLLVICASYAFFSTGDADADRWTAIAFGPWMVEVNLAGLGVALMMCLRVLVLVVASAWVQLSGKPGDFVRALERFRVPHFLAASIDGTIQLASGGGRGGGSKKAAARIGFRDIRRGRLKVVSEMVENAFARAEALIADANPGMDREQLRDIVVITGIATAIMAVKVITILPGLPIAPGHKNFLIIPLLLLAAGLTRTRFGGLWTGLTVGVVSVMLGYGKYGVLGIAPFAVPGFLADMLLPLARLHGSRMLRLIQFGAIGGLLGLGRFAAKFLVIVLAGAPDMALVLYLPVLISQVVFGGLSAFVSLVVLEPLSRQTRARATKGGARGNGPDTADRRSFDPISPQSIPTQESSNDASNQENQKILQVKQEARK